MGALCTGTRRPRLNRLVRPPSVLRLHRLEGARRFRLQGDLVHLADRQQGQGGADDEALVPLIAGIELGRHQLVLSVTGGYKRWYSSGTSAPVSVPFVGESIGFLWQLDRRFALLPELLRASDVVSLHVPLNDVTRGLMSTREFGLMKESAILINTCRGPVVDEDALYQALTTGKIAGAGLDVMTEEPPVANHSLFKLDNAIITPHMAGPTLENWTKAFRNGFDNVQRVAAGRTPMWVIPELRS